MRNKKGNIFEFTGIILLFSFISIVYLTIAILNFGVWNDYVLYNMQNITETLGQQGIISNETVQFTQGAADQFRTLNFHFDDLWFAIYMVFVFITLVAAYKSPPINYFSFLGVLFYGIMFILFMLTIFSTLTNWFNDNILQNIVPSAEIILPKFYFYLEHIGIFSAVHLVLCLIVNLFNFDMGTIKQSKQKEIEDSEVL